jgi:hypothetical protein
MSKINSDRRNKGVDPLLLNQLIGGSFAGLVVLFACIRIFVLKSSLDTVFANLMSISGAALSLVVLTSAVRIMLSTKKTRGFVDVLIEECDEIDRQYGALIEAVEGHRHDTIDGTIYMVADNLDAVFTSSPDQWKSLNYLELFKFSPDFTMDKVIFFYVNHVHTEARATKQGDSLETTARLLARDIAVALQRSFSDILTAHALDVTHEEGRAVVTIVVSSAETAEDAKRIGELIDYMLFLHFVTT